jgi:hypothetical protein
MITYISSSPDNLEPLTPAHFLVGNLGGQFAHEVSPDEVFHPRKSWRRIQQLIGQLWKRWHKEFLPIIKVGSSLPFSFAAFIKKKRYSIHLIDYHTCRYDLV